MKNTHIPSAQKADKWTNTLFTNALFRRRQVAWTHYGWHGRAVLTVDNNVITKNHRVSVLQEGGGAAWTLIIANVSTSDQGAYMCQINTVPPVKRYGHIKVVGKILLPSDK